LILHTFTHVRAGFIYLFAKSLCLHFPSEKDVKIQNYSPKIPKKMNKYLPLAAQLNKLAKNLAGRFPDGFSLDQERRICIGEEDTPLLASGGNALNMNFSAIDSFSAQTGVSATIFVKRDRDFIRISTSVKKENGERAVGTLLDHSHPGYQVILDGGAYIGFAQLFGSQYMTRYDSIRDSRGNVIAVLYVGINVESRFQFGISAKISLLAASIFAPVFALYAWLTSTAMPALSPGLLSGQIRNGVAAALALAIAFFLLYLTLQKTLARPMKEATKETQRLARGDLSTMIHVGRRDELGLLIQAINGVCQGLAGIVGNVRKSTDSINISSNGIALGNNDISARTESQASALEQISATMENFTSTARHNSENAHQASTLVASASEQALAGGTVVDQVVLTMGSIKESSHKVVDIIGVIDSIAFQTNILALNASVEAARAGEQGRGFAVVATEVRQLAQRSAAAAQEIKALIANSVEKVDNGSKLVDLAGKTMHNIVASVTNVASIMRDIAADGKGQSNDIAEVSQAINDMDEMTQKTAELVQEASAATEALRKQAEQLSKNVSIFKLA
jgi:methyl-accepting chemotaxis protein